MATSKTLDSFTRAYIECALWSSNDYADESGGEPLDKNYSIDDFAQETVDKIVADCARFRADNAHAIAEGPSRQKGDSTADEQAGHDFWLTRNGHGCGFWDGDWPEPAATRLTDAAKAFGTCDLLVGDDGLIYC